MSVWSSLCGTKKPSPATSSWEGSGLELAQVCVVYFSWSHHSDWLQQNKASTFVLPLHSRSKLWERRRLDGLIWGGTARMATHDRKPRGAAGVHFAPSLHHAQMQHMSCARGPDRERQAQARVERKQKCEGSKFNRNRYCSSPCVFPPQWIRSPHSSQSCLTHSSPLVFTRRYRLLPYKCVVCLKISTVWILAVHPHLSD